MEAWCLERHDQNIEIWPWSIGANKSSVFIYFLKKHTILAGMARYYWHLAREPQRQQIVDFICVLKENWSLERHCHDIEIWPWSLRANQSSIYIYFQKDNLCIGGMASILKYGLGASEPVNHRLSHVSQRKVMSWEACPPYWNMALESQGK